MLSRFSPFFRLPRELRDEIYALVFPKRRRRSGNGQLVDAGTLLSITRTMEFELGALAMADHMRARSVLAPLCQANKQLCLEAAPFYIRTCTIRLECPEAARIFLALLKERGEAAFAAVLELEFPRFERIDSKPAAVTASPYSDLLSKCKNLIQLSITYYGASRFVSRSLLRAQSSKIKEYHRIQAHPLHDWYYDHTEENPYVHIGRAVLWRMKVEYELQAVLDLPKLNSFTIAVRNETNPFIESGILMALKDWFQQVWSDKGQDVHVSSRIECQEE